MKIGLALLGVVATMFCAPAFSADKESPYTIPKKAFKQQYKTIALSPVDADGIFDMPDAVAAMLEEEITKHLQKRGFTVIPTTVLGDIRKKMERQVGGYEDPESGRINAAKMQAVRTHAFRELWFQKQFDAVATIRVSASQVPIESDNVKWDGAKQKIERNGRSKKYAGQIYVSSVSFSVYDQADKVLFSSYGGLEALMMRDKDQLVALPAEKYFKDEKRIRKAAQIAVSPI